MWPMVISILCVGRMDKVGDGCGSGDGFSFE